MTEGNEQPMVERLTRVAGWLAIALLGGYGVWLIVTYGGYPFPYPVDAFYYLSKAENFASGNGLTTYWNDAVDRKFFPFYSIALAPLTPLRGSFPNYWLIAAVALYLGNAAVLGRLLWRVEVHGVVRFATVAFWLCNYNVLTWASVPYSELLASLLGWSAVLLCVDGWRTTPAWRFALAGFLGGLALITRAEAILLALVFGPLLLTQLIKEGPRAIPWKRLATAGALFAAPFVVYWLTLPSVESEGARLWYVREFFENFSFEQLAKNFEKLFLFMHFEYLPDAYIQRFLEQSLSISVSPGIVRVAIERFYYLGLLLGLIGWFGRRGFWACVTLIGYQALHSLWHYSYGRFNVVVTPLAAYALACFIFTVCRVGPRGFPRLTSDAPVHVARRVVAGVMVFIAAALMAVQGRATIDKHHYFLTDAVKLWPQERQQVINAVGVSVNPGEAYLCSDDLWLAYRVGSVSGARAWFDAEKEDFFDANFEPGSAVEFLEEKDIRFIATSKTLDEWLEFQVVPEDARDRFGVRTNLRTFRLIEYRPPQQ